MNKLRMPDVFGRMLSQAGAFTYPKISTTDSMNLATLCYVKHSGRTLIVYRDKKPDDIHKGKWNGLGGKFRAGETPEE